VGISTTTLTFLFFFEAWLTFSVSFVVTSLAFLDSFVVAAFLLVAATIAGREGEEEESRRDGPIASDSRTGLAMTDGMALRKTRRWAVVGVLHRRFLLRLLYPRAEGGGGKPQADPKRGGIVAP
jgi:hypothetical protein